MTNTDRRPFAAALAATLGLAALCWGLTAQKMSGMNMGPAASLGPFPSFIAMWATMMAAMMLPGVAPAVLKVARDGGSTATVLSFVGAYLAVWAAIGLPVYALYQPHGTAMAGVITIAAGLYEFTPIKKEARRRCCHGPIASGVECAAYCVGTTAGLMAMQIAIGIMSLSWMIAVTLVICAQKLFPPHRFVDAILGLALIGLGVAIIATPQHVPGLMPAM
ncbi:DUF2182 domain-containing protein [uncultured Nitratireductor sp.]|uniref:DUF2182 domain-containing protein n=1 Tax=uncultured Nitratireductor sp. TaxID=520953 RepID=UPI0025D4D5F2|nr:DUF2182 domain-containing protein [uncultured Nitratireductor sp.]